MRTIRLAYSCRGRAAENLPEELADFLLFPVSSLHPGRE